MKGLFKFFSENSALVLFIATLALAVITYFYLRETRLIRKTSEKSFLIETSPKVFLADIKFERQLNPSKMQIEVIAFFDIKNAGKTEAKNFIAMYIFSSGRARIEGKIEAPYLFPNQGVQYQTKMFVMSLSKKNFATALKSTTMKTPLIIPEKITPPIFLDLNLRYVDQEEIEQNIPYKIKYAFHNNKWNFVIEEEK